MAKKKSPSMNFERVGEEIDILLTEIYGRYVAKGSPTKLGGLRFLDVASAKTFAFEKTQAQEEGGNLLTISAPVTGTQEEVEGKLKSGPRNELLANVVVRASSDKGKKGKMFVEPSYSLATDEWLTEESIAKVAEENRVNGNEAVRIILKREVLPIASDVMQHFVEIVREMSEEEALV